MAVLGNVLPSKQMSISVPSGEPLRPRQSSWTKESPKSSSRTTKFQSLPCGAQAAASASSRSAAGTRYASNAKMQAKTQVNKQKENRGVQGRVQIVEKKGDVAVWGPSRSQEQQSVRMPRIICYGDSNTVGYHTEGLKFQPYGQSLASELLDAGLPCEVVVCGLCGFTTEDMLNERSSDCVKASIGPSGRGLERMLEEDGPVDLVIIMTGTNDMAMSSSLTTVVQDVAKLHAICHERDIPTVAIAPTQGTSRKCRALRQRLAELIAKWAAAATGVLDSLDVEDLLPRPISKDIGSSLTAAATHWEPDGLHLSAIGSIALGRRLASHVSSWLHRLAADGSDLLKSSPRACGAPIPRNSGAATTRSTSTVIPAGHTTPPLQQLPRSVSSSEVPVANAKVSALRCSRYSGSCGFTMVSSQRQRARTAPFPTAMLTQSRLQLCM